MLDTNGKGTKDKYTLLKADNINVAKSHCVNITKNEPVQSIKKQSKLAKLGLEGFEFEIVVHRRRLQGVGIGFKLLKFPFDGHKFLSDQQGITGSLFHSSLSRL